ncbi:toxin-activating lysine-acyltransferase [Flexibacterium corallicola]|uniref:toxin-activating lysine-acyltransferase n=1 Tax=Flexibacterium corallicola TaxID=3037259 RepID=UPI00286F8718|nr:toxin-activating lysine-acyltransferase [Pseudovibrio sp. M1P-2-3]
MQPKDTSKASNFFSPQNGIYTRLSQQQRIKLLGEVTSLLLASKLHCEYHINDIGAVFLPPIHLNQFRIYRDKQTPVGLITWARLTETVEQDYVNGDYILQPQDWNAGDRLWCIDFLAPFGHGKQILKDLRTNVFPNESGKAMRIDRDGNPRGLIKLHGVNHLKAQRQPT